MPWFPAQATCTAPLAGCGNWKTYGPADEPLANWAGTLLISKSLASTPATGSLKVTSIRVSPRTVVPGSGLIAVTTGRTVSRKVYWAVSLFNVPLNGTGGDCRSMIPWFGDQVMETAPSEGCEKLKV